MAELRGRSCAHENDWQHFSLREGWLPPVGFDATPATLSETTATSTTMTWPRNERSGIHMTRKISLLESTLTITTNWSRHNALRLPRHLDYRPAEGSGSLLSRERQRRRSPARPHPTLENRPALSPGAALCLQPHPRSGHRLQGRLLRQRHALGGFRNHLPHPHFPVRLETSSPMPEAESRSTRIPMRNPMSNSRPLSPRPHTRGLLHFGNNHLHPPSPRSGEIFFESTARALFQER